MNTTGQACRSTRTGTAPATVTGLLGPTSWECSLAALRSFVAREGHALVPQSHVEDGRRLGQWVAAQRQARRRGDLGVDPAALLEALPGWSWDAARSRWHAAYAALAGFVAREGHARVPRRHVENGFALGAWVSTQRAAHRHGQLRPERAAALAALAGWTWDARIAR